MTLHQTATANWGLPVSRPVVVSLAVLADDPTFASHAVATLERDGMIVSLAAAGPDVYAVGGSEATPDLVIVRRAADRPGLEEVVEGLHRRIPAARILVVLAPQSRVQVGRLLSAGADGLVLEGDVESLLAAVARTVAHRYVSMPAEVRDEVQRPALSHRERQILGLAVAGLTNAQIAHRLFLAESTVKGHLASAFRRLGIHSRREAAALVLTSDDGLRRAVLATLRLSEALPRAGDDS